MSRLNQLRWDALQDLERKDPARARSTRIGQFVAAFALVYDGLIVAGFPINEFGAMALIVIAMTQMVRPGLKFPLAMVSAMVALAGWLAMSNVLNADPVNTRRVGHILVWSALAYVFASGRLHLMSVARGAAAGIVAGTALYLAGINVTYAGRLSGYLGDPNGAGMIICTIGLVCIALLGRSEKQRWLLVLPLAGIVLLTLSRTTITATTIGLVWVLVAGRIKAIFGVAAIGGIMQYLTSLPTETAQTGVFADRVGSDQLRERLLALEQIDVARHPWYGNGAGTARVQLSQTSELFYHNSFLAMRAEGGWIAIAIFVFLLIAVLWRAMNLKLKRRNLWLEAAVIAPLVCAINLGEVLLALPLAVALGVLSHHYWTQVLELKAAASVPYGPVTHPTMHTFDPRSFT